MFKKVLNVMLVTLLIKKLNFKQIIFRFIFNKIITKNQLLKKYILVYK
jgi:hypothetical protein